jgi:hypothetical protein
LSFAVESSEAQLCILPGGFQNGAGKRKPGGNLQFDDLCPGNGVGQQFDSLIGRVDGLSAERVKTGDKDLHEGNLRVLFSAHGKTKHSAAGAADDVHKYNAGGTQQGGCASFV